VIAMQLHILIKMVVFVYFCIYSWYDVGKSQLDRGMSEKFLELLFLAKWDITFSLYGSFVHYAD